jgi:sulfur-carrier protein
MIRVALPAHLRTLAGVGGEVALDLTGRAPAQAVTLGMVLEALEERHPVLKGTIRDTATGRRRAFVRYFACQQDLSHESPDAPLPAAVVTGAEPLLIVGAMAGG